MSLISAPVLDVWNYRGTTKDVEYVLRDDSGNMVGCVRYKGMNPAGGGLDQFLAELLHDPQTAKAVAHYVLAHPDELDALHQHITGGAESREKAWKSEQHPRDDHGRFVNLQAIHAAAHDPKAAAELKKKVTDPAERKKLDAAMDAARRKTPGSVPTNVRKGRGTVQQTAEQIHQTRQAAEEAGGVTRDHIHDLMHLIGGHTVAELRELKKHLGVTTTSGMDKQTAMYEIAQRALTWAKEKVQATKDRRAKGELTAKLKKEGFTGTDAHGRTWQGGQVVKGGGKAKAGGELAVPQQSADRTPAQAGNKLEPNTVMMILHDRDGNELGRIAAPHDGTTKGMRQAANALTERAEMEYGGEWSNINSVTGATDATGGGKFIISPNRSHVNPIESDEGKYTLGFLQYAPKEKPQLPAPAAESSSESSSPPAVDNSAPAAAAPAKPQPVAPPAGVAPQTLAYYQKAVAKRDAGKLVDLLAPANKTIRQHFEQTTGVKLPAGKRDLKAALADWAAGGSGSPAPVQVKGGDKPAAESDDAAQKIDLKDPQAVKDAVHAAAATLPDAYGNKPEAVTDAWQNHKVLFADLYDHLKDRLPAGTTLDQFKAAVAGHRGALNIGRADLDIPADRQGVYARSQHRAINGEMNVVEVPGADVKRHRAGQSAPAGTTGQEPAPSAPAGQRAGEYGDDHPYQEPQGGRLFDDGGMEHEGPHHEAVNKVLENAGLRLEGSGVAPRRRLEDSLDELHGIDAHLKAAGHVDESDHEHGGPFADMAEGYRKALRGIEAGEYDSKDHDFDPPKEMAENAASQVSEGFSPDFGNQTADQRLASKYHTRIRQALEKDIHDRVMARHAEGGPADAHALAKREAAMTDEEWGQKNPFDRHTSPDGINEFGSKAKAQKALRDHLDRNPDHEGYVVPNGGGRYAVMTRKQRGAGEGEPAADKGGSNATAAPTAHQQAEGLDNLSAQAASMSRKSDTVYGRTENDALMVGYGGAAEAIRQGKTPAEAVAAGVKAYQDLHAARAKTGSSNADSGDAAKFEKALRYAVGADADQPAAAAQPAAQPAAPVQVNSQPVAEPDVAEPAAEPTEPTTEAGAPAFSSEPPPVADTPTTKPTPAEKRSSAVADFGEEIGGARKHTARPTGPKMPKDDDGEEKGPAKPAWARNYNVHQDAKTGKWFITHGKKTDGWGGPKVVYVGGRRGDFDTKEEAEAAIPLHAVARTHGVRQTRKPNAQAAESTYGPDSAASLEADAAKIKALQDEHQELLNKHEFHKRVERGVADGSIPAETMRKFREEGRMLNMEDQIKAAKVKEQIADIRSGKSATTAPKANPDDEYEIYRKVTDRKTPTVKGGFKSYDEAMKHMAAHPHDVLNHQFPDWEEYSYLDHVRRDGPEHKAGDVTTDDFQKAFGFRGGQFGKWQENKDGQTSLNHAYHALHDLADVTGLTPKQLSLNGRLGIAFGARGTGGKHSAKAHYEPDREVMNLTKMKGAGSLGHEWFHALDHALAKGEHGENTDDLLTSRPAYQPKNKEVADAFKSLVDTMKHKQVTAGVDAAKAAKRAESAKKDVEYELGQIDYAHRSWAEHKAKKGQKQPITAEHQKKWDDLMARVKAGDLGEVKYVGEGISALPTHERVAELNDLFKQATGRSLTAGGADSRANRLHWAIQRHRDAAAKADAARGGVSETRKVTTDFHDAAKDIDQTRSGDYYSLPHEMAARAFAAYVEDKLGEKGRRSDYLAARSHNKHYAMFGMKPFPEGEERTAINAAFDRLFDAVRKHYGRTGG